MFVHLCIHFRRGGIRIHFTYIKRFTDEAENVRDDFANGDIEGRYDEIVYMTVA